MLNIKRATIGSDARWEVSGCHPALFAVVVALISCAGCLQQRTNQLIDYADRLLATSKGTLRVLKGVNNPESAKAAIPLLQKDYPEMYSLIREYVDREKAVNKAGGITKSGVQTLEERSKAFLEVMQEMAGEGERLRRIRGLPQEFWNVFRAESMKGVAMLMDINAGQFPPEAVEYLKNVGRMMDQYGPEKVVLIEARGTGKWRLAEIATQLQTKLGPAAQAFHVTGNGEASLMVGPIEDFDKFVGQIDFGEVTDKDPAQRLIYVNTNAPRPELVKQAAPPPKSVYKDLRPSWEQPSVLDNLRYDRMVGEYGKERIVRYWVTNFKDLKDPDNDVATVMHSLAQKSSTYDPETGTGYLGPVKSLDFICKELTFGEIVSRDDPAVTVKIKIDPAKVKARAADAKAHPEKFEYIKQRLPNPSDPDYVKQLADLMIDESNHANVAVLDLLFNIDAKEVKDKDVRRQLAQNYRKLATSSFDSYLVVKGVDGMARFGGKYSVPILIEFLGKPDFKATKTVFRALAEYPDPQGAEAIINKLSDGRNVREAEDALRKMGPVAEAPLIKAVASEDPRIGLSAIRLLGDIGTPRSMGVLTKAAKSKDFRTSDAAKAAIKAIRTRALTPAAK